MVKNKAKIAPESFYNPRASRALKRALDPGRKGLRASRSWCVLCTHDLRVRFLIFKCWQVLLTPLNSTHYSTLCWLDLTCDSTTSWLGLDPLLTWLSWITTLNAYSTFHPCSDLRQIFIKAWICYNLFYYTSTLQIEKDVLEAMSKALALCDTEETSSSRQPLYQYRAATIHHRLASMYHNAKRKQVKQ